jgi:hypothetical protein
MQRRYFITVFGGATVAWTLAARAQQAAKMPRIAFLSPGRSELSDPIFNMLTAFLQRLRDLGYTEGQNLAIERQYADGRWIGSPGWPLNWLCASPISLSRLVRPQRSRPSKQRAQPPSSRWAWPIRSPTG